MYLEDLSCTKRHYFIPNHVRFIISTNTDKIPKKTIVITILSAWKKKVNHQHYWENQQNENPSYFANQNFHFLSFGSSRCRIAHAFIPGGGLIWSEARKLKSQPMCTCQSIVCSYGKLSRLGTDKSEPIWSGLFKEEKAWMAIRNHLLLTTTFERYLDRTQSYMG